MKGRPFRTGDMAAAVLIGGLLVMAFPSHVLSVVQLVILTLSGLAGLHALDVNVPPTGWMSPFRWMSPFGRVSRVRRGGKAADDIGLIRSHLSGWRQPMQHGPPMPPDTLRLLKPVIGAALDLNPDDEDQLASVRTRLSPFSWAILTSDPTHQPSWYQMLPPNGGEVAGAVHTVLDEVHRITSGQDNKPTTLETDEPCAR